MSILIGRFRRVYTGWRALPGKNLLVFDDAIAVIRASGLDGAPFGGGSGLAMTAGAVVVTAAMRKEGSKTNRGLAPGSEVIVAELVAHHPDNWSIPACEINAVRFHWPRLRLGKAMVTFSCDDGERIVLFETAPNPKKQVADVLTQVFGERLDMA
jgi:hypothetical protein